MYGLIFRKFGTRSRRLSLASAFVLAPLVAAADEGIEDRVTGYLEGQGYETVQISRTWLRRLRFYARGPQGSREIIVDPGSGAVLYDYAETPDARQQRLDDLLISSPEGEANGTQPGSVDGGERPAPGSTEQTGEK